MTTAIQGARTWSCQMDDEGHRTYKIKYRIRCSDPADGPALVLQTAGLPDLGAFWLYGNDIDIWAFRLPATTVTPVVEEGEPNTYFDAELTFSTRPPDAKRCVEDQVTDPLLIPPKISGSDTRYSEEAIYDRFGRPIQTSSFEQIRGPQVEFDALRGQIRIEQNVPSALLGYVLPAQMKNTVNIFPLWGYPARCIKLSEAPWERRFYGNCEVYYQRTLVFDIFVKLSSDGVTYVSGFDRDLLDEGSKVLQGQWSNIGGSNLTYTPRLVGGGTPDASNPQHFQRYQDPLGNVSRVVLNGAGLPAGVVSVGSPVQIVNTTVVVNGTSQTLTLSAQPTAASRLKTTVAGMTVNVAAFTVSYLGKDANGGGIAEENEFAGVDGTYTTFSEFASITSITLTDITDSSPTTTIAVATDVGVTQIGNIHVEKYDESDFTLLNIPLVF